MSRDNEDKGAVLREALNSAPFFVMRTPLLAFNRWEGLGAGLTSPLAGDETLAAALAADRERVRRQLRNIVAQPEVREALFVASPSLYEALPLWLESPESERGLKIERSLVRYVARMCGRATPFGLFAGCTVGRVDVGGTTVLRLSGVAAHRRHSRLDMDYLVAVCAALSADPELRQRLRYRPTSTLYRAAGRLRYVQARLVDGARSHHLVAVEPSAHLETALQRARDGATVAQISAAVAVAAATEESEARMFVEELIGRQLLISELDPPITGPEPIDAIVRVLDGHRAAAPLAAARDALAALDETSPGADVERYRAVATSLARLPVAVEVSRLFQVDLVTHADEATLGGAVIAEVARAVELLRRMTRRRDPLRRFREAFERRYGSALMPLADVLDEEAGIGFRRSEAPAADASPLLAGLPFKQSSAARDVVWGDAERLLLDKLLSAAGRGVRELALTDEDLERLAAADPPPPPDSFAVTAALFGESSEAVAAGRFTLFVDGALGPSSANLLGRFCHGDARLHALVREELRLEEAGRADAIFAEIVHLPEGRIGNVLLRPLLRRWELPFAATSGAPLEQQLPLDDLFVTVDGDRVILWSRRLDREIVPRLTSAHNYDTSSSVGLYQFLCRMQSQNVAAGLKWDWGALADAPFLPRVVCGRIILARARWRLHSARLQPLREATRDERWRQVQAMRRELGLPRLVALADEDNLLPIDLDQVLSVETFAHLIAHRSQASVVEMLAPSAELTVRGPDGGYVSELIIPFRRPSAPLGRPAAEADVVCPRARQAPAVDVSAIERRVLPGAECLYVKLFAGEATVDELLRGVVAPLVAEMRSAGIVRDWFFVRYGDPDWHLRLRFFGDARALNEQLAPRLLDAARQSGRAGLLWSAQIDSYQREIERYGGAFGIERCERLFTADSDAALAIIVALRGDGGADLRWRLALLGIDRLLDDLGLLLDEKLALVTTLRADFAREFAVDGPLDKAMGARFRRERAALETLLAPDLPQQHPAALGRAAFDVRSRTFVLVAAELRAGIADGRVALPIASIAASLVHMHANRLLRASARANELVLYDFLQRRYLAQRARPAH